MGCGASNGAAGAMDPIADGAAASTTDRASADVQLELARLKQEMASLKAARQSESMKEPGATLEKDDGGDSAAESAIDELSAACVESKSLAGLPPTRAAA